jgi:hypothetical protein
VSKLGEREDEGPVLLCGVDGERNDKGVAVLLVPLNVADNLGGEIVTGVNGDCS